MPDITLLRSFALPIAVAKARVQKTADELAKEYDLRSEWDGNTLRFERTGLRGEIQVSDSEIRLAADLSFLLKPLKAQLTERIEDKFDRVFPEIKAGARIAKPAKK